MEFQLEGGSPDIGQEAEFGYRDTGSHTQLVLFLRHLLLQFEEHVILTETDMFTAELTK